MALPVKAEPGALLAPFDQRMRAFLAEEGKAIDGWVTFFALGQQRAKAMEISKAAAGMAKSVLRIGCFMNRPHAYEIKERRTQSRALLKEGKKA